MASSMALKLASVVLVCMIVGTPVETAITCGQVASSVAPCIVYIRSGGVPSPGCCSGVKSLNSAAKTTPDRKAVCNCLKTFASNTPGIKYGLAAGLPGKCRVSVPYKISPNTNCDTVK